MEPSTPPSMEPGLRRQLRMSMFLQTIACVFFGAAFVLKLVYTGIDFLTVLFLVLAVVAGVAAVWLFRRSRG